MRGRKKGVLDKTQKEESETNRKIVEKALTNFLAVGTNPTRSDMKREIDQICDTEGIEPFSFQTKRAVIISPF